MGLFDKFKRAEPVVKAEPMPELTVLEDRVEDPDLKQTKAFLNYEGPSRLAKAGQFLRSVGVKVGLVDPQKEFKRSKEIDHTLSDDGKDDLYAAKKYLVDSWANDLSPEQIKEAIKSDETESVKTLFTPKVTQTPDTENISSEELLRQVESKHIIAEGDRFREDKALEMRALEEIYKSKVEHSPIVIPAQDVEVKKEQKPNMFSERIKQASEKLKVMGKKSMDWHRDLSPRDKVKFGAAMAGMGILSGGITTVASKSFAVSRAIRSAYEREVVKITNGVKRELDTVEKRKAVLKACGIGLLIGGVGFGLSEVFETLNDIAPEIASGVTQYVPESMHPVTIMDSSDTILSNAAEVVPESGPTLQGVEAENILNEYTVQSKDSLEKILLDRGFEGYGEIDEDSKLKKIYNMFSSAEGKELLAEQGIANINDIKVGKVLDLDGFMDLLNKK